MNWPTRTEHHAHMKMRQQQNTERCQTISAENWMLEILKCHTDYKWKRQAQWGFRLFDFWNAELGIAIEVDGTGHDKKKDAASDRAMLDTSAIRVIRVQNFSDYQAFLAVKEICGSERWNTRRARVGMKPINSAS